MHKFFRKVFFITLAVLATMLFYLEFHGNDHKGHTYINPDSTDKK